MRSFRFELYFYINSTLHNVTKLHINSDVHVSIYCLLGWDFKLNKTERKYLKYWVLSRVTQFYSDVFALPIFMDRLKPLGGEYFRWRNLINFVVEMEFVLVINM